ncbi:MAG: hypothetical protein K2X81_11055 [Candidatus Obscuribacterales bacterium]|nr:hypothetical protein [Candidatus Obscuribacterales bacterium]
MSAVAPKLSKPFPANLLSSESVLIVLFTLSFALVALLLPTRSLNAADGVNSSLRILVTKLAEFFPSKEKPDVAILGSSLVLLPAARCDDKLAGRPLCLDRWYYDRLVPEYTKSTYLQELIKQKTGQNFQIKNLGVASSIMSDHYGIFEMLRAENKLPKLIIVGVAPRDFLDNSCQRHLDTPVRQFMREYEEPAFLSANWKAENLKDFAEKIEHRIEKVFAQMKSSGVAIACKVTGHPERVEMTTSNEMGRENRLKDLETYKKLYNPPNFKMLATQTEYLRKLLNEAKQSGVEVVLVNMPLTQANTAQLDPKALSAYNETLASVSQECGASYLNIGSASPDYALSDFEDCCHLNTGGGIKFYNTLASTVCQDRKIMASLNVAHGQQASIARKPGIAIQ